MTIKIGWSPKEIIWLRAALSLSGYECLCALDDIASMSGRTIGAVRAKAKSLQDEVEKRPDPKAKERELYSKGIFVDATSVPPDLRSRPREMPVGGR